MQVKIDTREKFHVITLMEPALAANMTAELTKKILSYLGTEVKNVVLNLQDIKDIESAAATTLLSLQTAFYESGSSFVICSVPPPVVTRLQELDIYDSLNVTPTESEAWDIVQMEELERELMRDN